MKKIKIILFLFVGMLVCFSSKNVYANSISRMDMDIYIDPYGNALVNEVWQANLTEGTEGYKQYYNIGKSSISDFTMTSDLGNYTFTDNWDVDASFSEKKFKNGFNYSNGGVELCFGITEYGNRTYNLKYKINNFIYKTKDGYQMLYWELISKKLNPKPKNSYIKIHADNRFSDSLDVWGFGNYGGTAYVYDGYIEASSKEGCLGSNEYITLLAKFPKDTFNISTDPLDKTFDEYLKMAKKGSTTYSEEKESAFAIILSMLMTFLIPILIVLVIIKSSKYTAYAGTKKLDFGKNGKKLTKKYDYFRDLPCNKSIFRAYWVSTQYGLNKKKEDFLGAVLLRWLKNGNISIKKDEVGLIKKKEESSIVLISCENMTSELERNLFNMMYKASGDGVLEKNEFKKWCNTNYKQILNWFDKIIDEETLNLEKEGKCELTTVTDFKIFKSQVYHINESVKDDAEQLDGLMRFFKDFTVMNEKQPIEVNLWEEYLMFAQILGMADKVAKDFKKLYPDQISDLSVDDVIFINNISTIGVTSASTARSRAESYSSGGGGFSSGGGGGGSFGGGGGGFR